MTSDTSKSESSVEDFSYFAHVQEIETKAEITELIELMEETNKNKNWLIDQIKKKRQKIQFKPDMGAVAILKLCQRDFIAHLIGLLDSQKLEGFDNLPPTLSKTYHWFYTDIVAGSDPSLSTDEQARKIFVLNKLIEGSDTFKQRDPDSTLILPTGDGVAIGFDDSQEKPLKLALEVHEGLYRYNRPPRPQNERVLIRIGLDTGPVYNIKDLNGKENVWGPGIITARRIMDLAREMSILASGRFANDVKVLKPEYKQIFHPVGDYQIKHGETILVHNVFGEGFGNKKSPGREKTQRSKAAEEFQQVGKRFIFNHVNIELEVTDIDPKLMTTHHILTWNVVNISKDPVERLFYSLDGDVAKAFPDLNLTVKDEDDKELEIMSLNVNKPYHKEFFVKFRRPLKPGEKGRSARLEYDWEEPERQYSYTFASDCKRLNYILTIPRDLEIHQKVVKIDTHTGEKVLAEIPAIVKYLPEKTEVRWSASNLHKHDAYRFDW
jgi:hypothetical protein